MTWYLKALPKQIRRQVVPISDFVTHFLEYLDADVTGSAPGGVALTEALAQFIRARTGISVQRKAGATKNRPRTFG